MATSIAVLFPFSQDNQNSAYIYSGARRRAPSRVQVRITRSRVSPAAAVPLGGDTRTQARGPLPDYLPVTPDLRSLNEACADPMGRKK